MPKPAATQKQPYQLEAYEMYGRGHHLLPEVPSVGFGMYYQAALGGPRPHANGIVYEICYINKGSVEWWIGNRLYEVGPGNIFINKPGEIYGGANAMFHPSEVYWMQLEFTNGPLPTMNLSATEHLQNDLGSMDTRFFPTNQDIKSHFDDMLDEYRQIQAYSTMAARAALHQIIVCTLRAYNEQETRQPSEDIRRTMNYIERHLTDDFPVEDLAKMANMSEGYYYKRFLTEVGYSPGEYRMRRRIYLTKYLLRDREMPITDIAFLMGFSSSQYFATVFRKLVGLTPRDYRQIANATK